MEILEHPAGAVALRPDTTVSGTERLTTRGWYLNTRIEEKAASAVVATEHERWTRPDGPAFLTHRDGAPEFPSEAYGLGGAAPVYRCRVG